MRGRSIKKIRWENGLEMGETPGPYLYKIWVVTESSGGGDGGWVGDVDDDGGGGT